MSQHIKPGDLLRLANSEKRRVLKEWINHDVIGDEGRMITLSKDEMFFVLGKVKRSTEHYGDDFWLQLLTNSGVLLQVPYNHAAPRLEHLR